WNCRQISLPVCLRATCRIRTCSRLATSKRRCELPAPLATIKSSVAPPAPSFPTHSLTAPRNNVYAGSKKATKPATSARATPSIRQIFSHKKAQKALKRLIHLLVRFVPFVATLLLGMWLVARRRVLRGGSLVFVRVAEATD